MSYEKIILVTRKTRLEELVERFNTRAQAAFYIAHSGGDFSLYVREHDTYQLAVSELRRGLRRLGKIHAIERSFLPTFVFSETDLVVTIGIDGLVVNTAKYLQGQPLIAVNPDPQQIDGILLPFDVNEALKAVRRTLHGESHTQVVTMAEATLNDGQRLLAFNDLFIGRHDHISARYRIDLGDRSESHSSSGVIVSTGAGATGWLSSLFNMADGLSARFSSKSYRVQRPRLAWDTDQLVFVVREPFVSRTSDANIVCGLIDAEVPLRLESTMPDGGVIFSDGIVSDYLGFNAGTIATIGLSASKTSLVIP